MFTSLFQPSDDVLKELQRLSRATSEESRIVLRASIVLKLLSHISVREVAEELACGISTVRKWGNRFLKNPSLSSLRDAQRSGRPCDIPASVKCEIAAIACSLKAQDKDDFYNIWTLNAIKDATFEATGVSVSKSEIHRILNNGKIHPHREKIWLHSRDPEFQSKTEVICGLYLDAPEGAHVVCVDEKTGMQATERVNPSRSAGPGGQLPRTEFEYRRHGTQSLIASFDVATGAVFAHCGSTRTAEDLVLFMEELAELYDEGDVHIIWDNLNIHKGDRWNKFNEKHGGRFHFVHTPVHASWINQIEIWFGILQRRVLNKSSFLSTEHLQKRVLNFIDHWNEHEAHPFKWVFRGKFKKAA